jgi:hypothetical protein
LSTIWGLVQISFLLGYGLIHLPQSLARKDIQTLYEIELCNIFSFDQAKHQSELDIEYLIATIKGMKNFQL